MVSNVQWTNLLMKKESKAKSIKADLNKVKIIASAVFEPLFYGDGDTHD